MLGEFGIVLNKGIGCIGRQLPGVLEDSENGLTGACHDLFHRLLQHFRELDRQVRELEGAINTWHRQNFECERLEKMPGIGPITATALMGSVGDARAFRSGKQMAAWLGLVPRQNSSGGKERLLGISKRGDVYLRTLLIHGARSFLPSVKRRGQEGEGWLGRLLQRRSFNVAVVAMA